ncbi:MFS transporter [Radiobacillus deserti]|uniref:MFS transporter n=1 Tax=Radiobacillus deserti TaxID=2594883 RepID=UPI001E65DB52|nr:MFS transporter [Radiobacillus deserti]
MTSLLKNKGYLTLIGAQAISSIGDWLSIVAIITMVGLKWNASPLEVSLIMLCLAIPMALFGPVAGVVADRLNRKTLMISSDLIRAMLIFFLAFADTIWMVYICLFSVGMFSAVFIPAKNAKLKELVPDDDMRSAMSITSMIDSSTKILGPLLSGVLVTAFGAKPVFFIDSATFLLSALLLCFLPKAVVIVVEEKEERDEKKDTNSTSFFKELASGFTFVKQHSFMLVGLLFLGSSLLVLQLSDSQIIVLLRELTYASPDLFGYAVTAAGAGTFLSGLYLTKKTDYNPIIMMLIGVSGVGLGFGLMALFTFFDFGLSTVWCTLFAFIAGFTAGFVFVPFHATVQMNTPVHMTGKVFGVVNSVTTTATIIGPLLGGWLSTIIGVIPTFIITGSILIMMSVIGLILRHKIDGREEHVPESKSRTSGAATN